MTGYARYLDWGEGFMSVDICQNLSDCTFKADTVYCMLIISQAVKKKK